MGSRATMLVSCATHNLSGFCVDTSESEARDFDPRRLRVVGDSPCGIELSQDLRHGGFRYYFSKGLFVINRLLWNVCRCYEFVGTDSGVFDLVFCFSDVLDSIMGGRINETGLQYVPNFDPIIIDLFAEFGAYLKSNMEPQLHQNRFQIWIRFWKDSLWLEEVLGGRFSSRCRFWCKYLYRFWYIEN